MTIVYSLRVTWSKEQTFIILCRQWRLDELSHDAIQLKEPHWLNISNFVRQDNRSILETIENSF